MILFLRTKFGTSVIYLFECFVFEVICLQFKLIFFDFNVMNVDISYTYYQHWRDIYQKSMIVGEKNERKRNFLQQMWHNFWQINIKDYKIHNSGENIGHACLRMVKIGRPLLDPNFKNISSVHTTNFFRILKKVKLLCNYELFN